ncbi:AMP-binding protein [Streptomyces canus]|nr:AMP-binding protein [Streptomyces canus]
MTTPHATAVVDGLTRLSYQELSKASDSYAADLAAEGIGPGSLVPVALTRSAELVAVLLAVLKRGAAYSVLDPNWPANRIEHVVGQLGGRAPVSRVRPLAEAVRDGRCPAAILCPDSAPAAVFFTSGTTGTPKGVISPHRATTRLFGPGSFAAFGPGHVTLAAAATSWDAFTLELWGPLTSGGTVVLSGDSHLLPNALAAMIRGQGVDTAWLTSSLFNLFVDEDLEAFRGLRQLLIGGERLSPKHVRSFQSAHPEVVLTNGYGPVESCVFATTHRIQPEDSQRPEGIPLGRPVAGTTVVVLRDGIPCRSGEVGEIHIGGTGLALGYLGAAEETTTRFTEHQMSGSPVRLYSTGDLGTEDAKGVLHYRGRKDRQVKVHGMRIEPQEVEVVCESLGGIDQAAVVPVTDSNGACDHLALFYTAETGGRSLAPSSVRDQLAKLLPAHYIPARVTRLPALPLTTNGKTDVRRLATMAAETDEESRSAVERTVHEVMRWSAASHDADLGNVPFTALGGSSLDVLRLCARLQHHFGPSITVSKVLQEPTLEGVLRLVRSASAPMPLPEPDDVTIAEALPLTGMRAHFCMSHDMRPDDPSVICQLQWAIHGDVSLDALQAAVDDVHARHEALRTAYRIGDGPEALIGAGVPGPRLHRLNSERDEVAARAVLTNYLRKPLDIPSGEVWRCAVVPLDTQTVLFGIGVHHVAFDGWSQGLLVSELSFAYAARLKGTAPRFDRPAPGLRDVAREEARLLDQSERERQLEYWVRDLDGIADLVFPSPEGGSGASVGRLSFALPAAAVKQLVAQAEEVLSTLFLPLLVSYQAAVGEVLGQQDFGIGVPIARRSGPLATRAVSCLIDMVCLRLPPGDTAEAGRMAAAKETVATALAYREATFEEVVAALRQRQGRTPLYRTIFAYQNNEVPELGFASCTSRSLVSDETAAMAELVCEVWPGPGGGLRVDLTYQRTAVPYAIAHQIARAFEEKLTGGTRL